MRNICLPIAMLCAAIAVAAPSRADEIEGTLADVSDKSVKITLTGDLLPAVGDEAEIFVVIPGLDEEARVATARVTQVGVVFVVAGIRTQTGEVVKGQQVRIVSPAPVRRSELRISPAQDGKPWIGSKLQAVAARSVADAKLPPTAAVQVAGVMPGGPADGAGLRAGDVLLKLDGGLIGGAAEFVELVGRYAVGEEIRLEVFRGGQTLEVRVQLGPQFNESQLARSMQIAAQRGEAWAQGDLAVMYSLGNGVKRNDAEAVRWYHLAAEGGDATSQANLGLRYLSGRGVDQDDREAIKWIRGAAEQGHASGMNGLAWMYENGRGTAQNNAEAAKWYRRAAEKETSAGDEFQYQAVLLARYSLGIMYENGRGVAKNLAEARKWYQKAAEQGHAEAQINLGRMYHSGLGVKQDYREAMKWYHLAAKQKHPVGQTAMGLMILHAEGVKKDYKTAMAWLKLAAKQKNAAAQNTLGAMYLNGWGVPKNEVEGFTWLLKSSDQGFELARKNLRDMGIEP